MPPPALRLPPLTVDIVVEEDEGWELDVEGGRAVDIMYLGSASSSQSTSSWSLEPQVLQPPLMTLSRSATSVSGSSFPPSLSSMSSFSVEVARVESVVVEADVEVEVVEGVGEAQQVQGSFCFLVAIMFEFW